MDDVTKAYEDYLKSRVEAKTLVNQSAQRFNYAAHDAWFEKNETAAFGSYLAAVKKNDRKFPAFLNFGGRPASKSKSASSSAYSKVADAPSSGHSKEHGKKKKSSKKK